ncbi:DUF1501 domain-containing protein [Puteibacter caeruleilacunae]|nr:DUF1501 domain-containing protein [Puteibacter caeruleilacunae]
MKRKNKKHTSMSRRRFIGTTSCATISSTTLFSSILNLGVTNSLVAGTKASFNHPDDYKALVCILLSGGNDSFNMLVPYDNANYNIYAKTRSNLAIPHNQLLKLGNQRQDGRQFGLHPSMPEVQQLFNNGKLSFISNIGTLVEPMTKLQYLRKQKMVPVGLLSHADQAQQWMTAIPQTRSSKGWGGRMADIIQSGNSNKNISMNISLSGTNIFQVGDNAIEYAIRASTGGSVGINALQSNAPLDKILQGGVSSLLEHQYKDIFKSTFAKKIAHAQHNHLEFSSALSNVSSLQSSFSDNNISANFALIAKTIAARNILGMRRQTFFINFTGWDHHDMVLQNQRSMLATLSKALGEFQNALEELKIADRVTTFTISDFGRTLTSNGNGSDHAWGGNVMIMGDGVNGGKIYGNYPSLALNSNTDIGGAIMIPTTSTDEYFAEIAQWFGIQDGDLEYVLPNINRFYDPKSKDSPIGFMKT